MVDTRDLKSLGPQGLYGFESRPRHEKSRRKKLRLFRFFLRSYNITSHNPTSSPSPAVGLEEFECCASLRTFLQPVQNQTGLPWNKGSTGDDGREVHYNVIHLLGALKGDFGLRLFEEIDVNDIGIIDPGKLPDRKSLAALADTLDD